MMSVNQHAAIATSNGHIFSPRQIMRTEAAVKATTANSTYRKSCLIFRLTSIFMAHLTPPYSIYIPCVGRSQSFGDWQGYLLLLCGAPDIHSQSIVVDVFLVTIPELAQNLLRRKNDVRVFHKQAQQFIFAGRQVKRNPVFGNFLFEKLNRMPLDCSSGSACSWLKFSLRRSRALILERNTASLNGLVI